MCPFGTEPCSEDTSPPNTVCYLPVLHKSSCPITSVTFISKRDAMIQKLLNKDDESKVIQYQPDSYLRYSKTEGDNLPLTSTIVGQQPCVDKSQSSIER